jgi:hypothetical protein
VTPRRKHKAISVVRFRVLSAPNHLKDGPIIIPGLLFLILYTIVVGLMVWLCWYIVDVTRIPAPFNWLVKIVAAVLGILVLIVALMQLMASPFP